jgi:uncharacterized protein (DUF433 family)
LDKRLYVMADVDRYLGLKPGTARRWIDGYRREGTEYPPVIRPQRTGDETVCWGEFVEAQLLTQFRGAGVPLQRLRPAVVRLRDEMGSQYPLAAARTLLDVRGRELVMKVQESVDLPEALSLVVVRSGQRILSAGAQSFVDRVDYGQPVMVAQRVRAMDGSHVWFDPVRAWGRPAVRAVPTEALAEGFRAGESVEELADLFELDLRSVEDALRFEMSAAHTLIA